MRLKLLVLCLVLLLSSITSAQTAKADRRTAKAVAGAPYDLAIVNGRILDGTGNPWFLGDIGIRDARIVDIARPGKLPGRARKTIDAAGRIVAPGFIDMHTHSDIPLLADGDAHSKVRQGVTTEILGEASSVAPRCPKRLLQIDPEADTNPLNVEVDWKDLTGYFTRLRKQKMAVNVGTFVATGTVRRCAMGADDRAPTDEELNDMRAYVEEAMMQGALGLSAGLIYPPGSFAKTEEIVELAKVAARYGGIYSVHMRSEGDRVLDAIRETVAIGEQAGLPVHIMHIKAAGKNNWGRMTEIVQEVEAARARGVEISADQYPYIASSTGLTARLPGWAQDGGTPKLLERLRSQTDRQRIRDAMNRQPYDWNMAMVARVRKDQNKQYEGKSIAQVAEMQQKDPVDAIFDLLLDERGTVGMVYFGMNEDDVKLAMKQPWVSVGSDGSSFKTTGILSQGKPHPRSYGTHARVLGRYVREWHVIGLEDAVRKMTSLAASQLGITDRGLLKKGMYADVVVFDPAKVEDKATFVEPHQYAVGPDYVIVNGDVVIENGEHTGARPGRIIYGAGKGEERLRPKT